MERAKMAVLQKLDPKSETNKAVDAITTIADVALGYRGTTKLTLGEVARIANRAAALLKLKDVGVENASAIAIARKYNLVS
jgi:hypothetical protein